MKVKIKKCSGDSFWYKDKIGQEFEVSRADFFSMGNRQYLVEDGNKRTNKMIQASDVEVIQ